MRRLYASKLTKQELIEEGITNITKDARIFKGEREVFPHWIPGKRPYLGIMLYERDEAGHLIKGNDRVYKYKRADGTIGESISWQAKVRTIGLHRVMWAWFHDEVPESYVVDHIDNKHETLHDYRLENLQLLTPKENLAKDITYLKGDKEIKCKMNKPRSFYEEKLLKYEKEYEQAKKDHNAKAAHNLRGNISSIRARLRYWDSHADEYIQCEPYEIKKENKLIDHEIKKLKTKLNKTLKNLETIKKSDGKWANYNKEKAENIEKKICELENSKKK